MYQSRICRLTSVWSLLRYPDLAGYSNYLENVLKNVSTGQTYYDGINEDYNFLTTNQPGSSCLTESATSYQVICLPSSLLTFVESSVKQDRSVLVCLCSQAIACFMSAYWQLRWLMVLALLTFAELNNQAVTPCQMLTLCCVHHLQSRSK